MDESINVELCRLNSKYWYSVSKKRIKLEGVGRKAKTDAP